MIQRNQCPFEAGSVLHRYWVPYAIEFGSCTADPDLRTCTEFCCPSMNSAKIWSILVVHSHTTGTPPVLVLPDRVNSKFSSDLKSENLLWTKNPEFWSTGSNRPYSRFEPARISNFHEYSGTVLLPLNFSSINPKFSTIVRCSTSKQNRRKKLIGASGSFFASVAVLIPAFSVLLVHRSLLTPSSSALVLVRSTLTFARFF